MKLLGSYINGNYRVSIFDDGTKIRDNKLNFFTADAPESMDIKITDMCECNCPYCHENSTPDGKHGDIMNAKFIEALHPYTELAIGGGNPLCHPQLVPFLEKCKKLKLIPSMTVNQKHFLEFFSFIKSLVDHKLIYGVGVSLTGATDELVEKMQAIPNSVLHVINGVVSPEELRHLYDKNLKVLILGYKTFRRGETFYSSVVEQKKQQLFNVLPDAIQHFDVVSFDNLAIKQLEAKRLMPESQWNEFYMGDDGQFTMYIDMVKEEFALSSTAIDRYKVLDDIRPMFAKIKSTIEYNISAS